jgi:protein involved in polysaccharide export with SLBB domain
MNSCPNHLTAANSPAVSGSRPRRWWTRIFNRTTVVMSGLVLLFLPGAAQAADGPDTNPPATTNIPAITNLLASSPAATSSVPISVSEVTNHVNVLDDQYPLTIGDQLSFRILEDEDDPKLLVVTDSGDIQVPYIGRYPAAGKTCKDLALALKAELEKEYYKQATVIIAVDSKPKSRGKIYLVGAIRNPGPQDIGSDEVLTVSKAILRAGSFTDTADQKNVKVTRSTEAGPGHEKTMVVNVSRIFEKGKNEDDLPLQPGDLIFVPERMIRF